MVGNVVAVVGDHHPRSNRQGITTVIPLLACCSDIITATAFDQGNRRHAKGLAEHLLKIMFFGNGWVGLPVGLMQDENIHPPLKASNLWVDGEFVVVNHRKDGIQMHKGVTLRNLKRNHCVKIRLGKELRRHQLNRLW